MKISAVMTVYNGMPYLAEQLDSMFRQSRVPDEIVVTDDGSGDGSAECIAEFARQHPGVIRYERNPERLGCSKNFEKGIALATGDAIFLADQDDVWRPDKVARMMDVLKKSDPPCGVFSDSRVTDQDLQPAGTTHLALRGMGKRERAILCEENPEKTAKIFWKRVPAAGHDVAFHAALKSVLLPFPELPDCYDTWIGLVLAALGRWHYVDECLTNFRQHGNNVSGSGARRSIAMRYREAKNSIASNTFAWNRDIFEAVLARLEGNLTPEIQAGLEARKAHSAARAKMNAPLWKRLPLILQETVNGNYFRYGRGMANVVQDVFLR